MRLSKHGAYSFKGRLARRKHTQEMLRGILRVRHDGVQFCEIVVAYTDLVCSKQRFEPLPAYAYIQSIDAWTVKVGYLLILVACGGNGRERVHVVIAVEKERISHIDSGFDLFKCICNVACDK